MWHPAQLEHVRTALDLVCEHTRALCSAYKHLGIVLEVAWQAAHSSYMTGLHA